MQIVDLVKPGKINPPWPLKKGVQKTSKPKSPFSKGGLGGI